MNRLFWLLAFLLGAASLCAKEARAQEEKKGITQIVLQRTWCFGRCPIDRLVLNADGSANYTGEKNTPRLGHFNGELDKQEFERLALWIERAGFFDLNEESGRANIDVSDVILTVKRDRLFHTVVMHRLGESPLAWAMQTMVRGAASNIGWRKDEAASTSGIRGSTRRTLMAEDRKLFADIKPPPKNVAVSYVSVVASPISDYSKWVACVTNLEGNFSLALPPGKYHVSTFSPRDWSSKAFGMPKLWLAQSETVEVKAGTFTPVTLLFEDKTPAPAKPAAKPK